MLTFALYCAGLLAISFFQESIGSDFNDMGRKILIGFVLAVVFAIAFTIIKLQLRDKHRIKAGDVAEECERGRIDVVEIADEDGGLPTLLGSDNSRGIDHGPRRIEVDAHAEVVAAEPNDGHLEAGAAKVTEIHGETPRIGLWAEYRRVRPPFHAVRLDESRGWLPLAREVGRGGGG